MAYMPTLEERAETYNQMRSGDSSEERKEGRLGLTLAIAAIEIRDAIRGAPAPPFKPHSWRSKHGHQGWQWDYCDHCGRVRSAMTEALDCG